jgi:hypothetical protein
MIAAGSRCRCCGWARRSEAPISCGPGAEAVLSSHLTETGQTGREGDEPPRAARLGLRSGKHPMAKGQKKSNKEARKPKAEKPKVTAAAPSSFLTPLKIGKQK